MRKLIVIAGVLIAVLVAVFIGFRMYTKSFSPRDISTYSKNDIELSIQYGRPYKKDRLIFDGLVPYGEVWRTGANEPTVFTTNVDLKIGEDILKKGEYAVFTVPNRDNWQIIFNKTIPSWGVRFSGEAAREPSSDALVADVSPITTKNSFEQFTIAFEEMHDEIDIVMMWDKTLVVLPMIPTN
ncbi:MAG TPA: DUF2911 domain-containing protein [Fulvivirga sp.]|nr:DUF2911 domain-containing protein [Fulvivirga sp.]